MKQKAMTLQVVTPEHKVFEERVEAVVVSGVDGSLGILPNHAPFITALEPGALKYKQHGEDYYLSVSGGFMEVNNNHIIVLADAAEKPEEIDKRRAKLALARALERLKEHKEIDHVRAELALKRAMNRLRVTKSYRHK